MANTMNVNRRSFLKGAAVGGVLVASGEAFAGEPVRGRVTAGGKPMKGVVVTDGLNCAETAADGTFAIPAREGVRFVSVTVPDGWRTKERYIRFSATNRTYDFDLRPWAPSKPGAFNILHIGDSEISVDLSRERGWVERAKRFADERDCAFVVHTGDITTKQGDLHMKLMNEDVMGRPVFYIVGNHDIISPERGEQVFEEVFGPCWYSFDAGGVHFIATPMMWGDGKPSYTVEDVVAWLRNDLAIAARRKQPVMLLTHGCYDTYIYDATKLYSDSKYVTKDADPFDLAQVCDFRGIIHGHLHDNSFRRSDDGRIEVVDVATPNTNNATLQVIHVDRNRKMLAENRYGHLASWPVVTTPPPGGWIAKVDGIVSTGEPCVAGGRVFVATVEVEGRGGSGVHAFDAKTGRKLWFFPTQSGVRQRVLHHRGKALVQDVDWQVYALDAKTGRQVWRFDARKTVGLIGKTLYGGSDATTDSAMTLDAEHGRLYVGTVKKALFSLDPETGTENWHAQADNPWFIRTPSAPCVGDGVVVGGMYWGGLFGYDAQTGKELWKHVRNNSRVTQEWYRSGLPWIERIGYPVFHGGRLYLTSANEFLEVDIRTGEPLRRLKIPGNMGVKCFTAPLFHDGRIYFGSTALGLICVDEKKFEILWTAPVEEAMLVTISYFKPPLRQLASVPVLWKGLVWATCQDGALYGWDPQTGERRERVFTGAPYLASATVADGCLYAADHTGRVRCFR